MREVRNAVIRSVMLGREDHGIPTAFVHLDYGGAGQGFGGYGLDNGGMSIFVLGVLDTLKKDEWEKLPGTPVRADADHGKVYRIGHLLEDRWFDPEKAFADARKGRTLGERQSSPEKP